MHYPCLDSLWKQVSLLAWETDTVLNAKSADSFEHGVVSSLDLLA